MNINNILMISYVRWDLLKIKKLNKLNIVVWFCCSKGLLCGIHTSRFPYGIQRPNLMKVQTSKKKLRHTYKKLIRITTLECEKLLLKSPQNKVASNFIASYKSYWFYRRASSSVWCISKKIELEDDDNDDHN